MIESGSFTQRHKRLSASIFLRKSKFLQRRLLYGKGFYMSNPGLSTVMWTSHVLRRQCASGGRESKTLSYLIFFRYTS